MAMLNNQRVYIYISWFSKHIITISSSVFIHQTRISLGRPSRFSGVSGPKKDTIVQNASIG